VAAVLARSADDVGRLRSVALLPPTIEDLYHELLEPAGPRRDR
jgi:hypothetical protein